MTVSLRGTRIRVAFMAVMGAGTGSIFFACNFATPGCEQLTAPEKCPDLATSATADTTQPTTGNEVTNGSEVSGTEGTDSSATSEMSESMSHTSAGTEPTTESETSTDECGNGVVDEGEACDDSGESESCNADCTEHMCGDGVMNEVAGEQCDNGAANANDADCTSTCMLNICGDGLKHALNEQCDPGLAGETTQCDEDCTFPMCGDGEANQAFGEECDDGNDASSDGCEPSCRRTVRQVAAGQNHNCAVFDNGNLRCWGGNEDGQLGYDDNKDIGDGGGEMPPENVVVGGTVRAVALGVRHSCAILTDDSVRCWGEGGLGRLGYGSNKSIGDGSMLSDNMPPPTVDVGGSVEQLALGDLHTCALLQDGTVRCWGFGAYLGYGALPEGHIGDEPGEMPPPPVAIGEGTVHQLVAGERHTCVLMSNGAVRCWGEDWHGYGSSEIVGDSAGEMPPPDVDLGGIAVQITAGSSHTCVLMDNGDVKCWGNGSAGRLGTENSESIGDEPGEMPPGTIDAGPGVTEVVAGGSYSCSLASQDRVRCWGGGFHGIIGNGESIDIGDNPGEMPPEPIDVNISDELPLIQLAAGGGHACVLLEDGSVRCWGNGCSGQLGHGYGGCSCGFCQSCQTGPEYCFGDNEDELPPPNVMVVDE